MEFIREELSDALTELKELKSNQREKDLNESINSIEERLEKFEVDIVTAQRDSKLKSTKEVKDLRDSLLGKEQKYNLSEDFVTHMETGALIFCKRTNFSDQAWFLLRVNDVESKYYWINQKDIPVDQLSSLSRIQEEEENERENAMADMNAQFEMLIEEKSKIIK